MPAPAKNQPAATSPAPTEPVKPASGAEIPVSERATKAQRELYLKRMQSHVFSEDEKRFAKVACDDVMLSKVDLSKLLDDCIRVTARRKAAEKQAKADAVARLQQGGYGD